jgi:signal transduction histidine kinase
VIRGAYRRQLSNDPALSRTEDRSPLANLLHALNQPLTGLQCSMEVALLGPRTPEQYIRGLREGLELTKRMRVLVDAIREVADGEEERNDNLEVTDLMALLRECLVDLEPVSEANSVCVTLDSAYSPLPVKASSKKLASTIFRFLESVLNLAAPGSVIKIETVGRPGEGRIRVRWLAERPTSGYFGPELGLLVAQAGLERTGAEWERERKESLETVTVRLARVSAD